MASLPRFADPAIRYFTTNIQSLPGAKLYFTAAGSSTPKVVYQDKAGTIPHADPVVANPYGIFAPIFLDGLYKVDLKSSAGLPQSGWPIDNVGQDDPVPPFAAWDSTVSYNLTDNSFATGSDGFYYQVIQIPNLNKNPISQPTYWKKVELLQTWNASVNYPDDAIVIYQGRIYASNVTPNLNHVPPNASYWDNVSFNASITGPFTATGTITGNALVSTTSTTTATLVASGAISGASVAVTGAATAATVTASGAITAGSYVGGSLSKTTDTGINLVAKKTSATNRNTTTTLAADPDLTTASLGTGYYAVRCIINWQGQGSTTNGIKARINTTTGSITVQAAIATTNTTASNSDTTGNDLVDTGAAFAKLPNYSGGKESLILDGVINVTGAGPIYFEWAQASSEATNTTVNAGYLIVTRL